MRNSLRKESELHDLRQLGAYMNTLSSMCKIYVCFSFLLLLIAVFGCCKLMTEPAKIRLTVDKYPFAINDSLKIRFYIGGATANFTEKSYGLNADKEIVFNGFNDNYYSYSYEMVIISNAKFSITDTLKNLLLEEKSIRSGCPGISQMYASFDWKGKKYGPADDIIVVIKP